jgi:hypothetical protein
MLSLGAVPDNFKALWTWDASRTKWYFYSPQLEQLGAPFTNCQYAAANHYLDFGDCAAANAAAWVPNPPAPALSLTPGLGFWVEKFQHRVFFDLKKVVAGQQSGREYCRCAVAPST